MELVLQSFDEFYEPQKNIPFERYRFHARAQEAGDSFDIFVTEFKQLSSTCDFESITKDQILRDKVLFGIRDEKVRGRLLRVSELTLKQTLDICRAAEVSEAQLKAVGDLEQTVNAVNVRHDQLTPQKPDSGTSCGNCGMHHEPRACPAFDKVCHNCGKKNHFSRMCRQKVQRNPKLAGRQQHSTTHFVAEDAPVFCVADGKPGTRGIVTLQVSSNSFIQFHVDTGAECNVLPLHIYRKATDDHNLSQVMTSKSSIILYGGAKKAIVGNAKIPVKYKGFECFLNCRIIDDEGCRPLLGKDASIGMGIIEIDDDVTNKPHTYGGQVHTVETPPDTTNTASGAHRPTEDATQTYHVLREFTDVLSEDAKARQHSERKYEQS